jgi:DNA polymerase-3 subunit alpha
LSFVLGITALDPLEYDLIFERFLNPGRISMPDIDTDFEDTYRDKVIEYIRDRYGKDNVAHIGTYMSLAAKAAFKDVARVM